MSISRKENGSLVKKAGRALVDLALSLTSNNAVEFCAPANGNTGGLAWDGTMQIIEWD